MRYRRIRRQIVNIDARNTMRLFSRSVHCLVRLNTFLAIKSEAIYLYIYKFIIFIYIFIYIKIGVIVIEYIKTGIWTGTQNKNRDAVKKFKKITGIIDFKTGSFWKKNLANEIDVRTDAACR